MDVRRLAAAGALAAIGASVALAAAPLPSRRFAGSGADYLNDGPTWRRAATGAFTFRTSADGTRMTAFRGSYVYHCPSGRGYVTAGYLNVTRAGRFDYRFTHRDRYGVAYVEIRGAFLAGGRRARLSYLVDFVAKGRVVHDPYDTGRPRALGCASWVRGVAGVR